MATLARGPDDGRGTMPAPRCAMPDCPTDELLAQYAADLCSIEEAANVAAHLETCERCCERVDRQLTAAPLPPRVDETVSAESPARVGWQAAGRGAADTRRRAAPRHFAGYEVSRKLSHGGQGVVYLARQVSTRRNVALKVLPRSVAARQESVERFRREAQAAARLNHPNIVTVYERGVAEGLHYIAYEFVDGQSLEELLKQEVPLYEAQIVEIALSVARALQHAHEHGVLHRDVKPGNILLNRAGDVKLTDFGLAKYHASVTSFQTTSGRLIGTPAFLSPEQVHGDREVDVRSDIYSLGCVIYNMAARRPPFVGDNAFVIMDQHRRADPTPLRQVNPRISTALEALVARAMAKLPEHRYPSVARLIEDLVEIRAALRAPDTARGGLAQIVAAVDHINVVGRRIRSDQAEIAAPSWQARLTARFLQRPAFWFGAAALTVAALAALAFWIGLRLGSGTAR